MTNLLHHVNWFWLESVRVFCETRFKFNNNKTKLEIKSNGNKSVWLTCVTLQILIYLNAKN